MGKDKIVLFKLKDKLTVRWDVFYAYLKRMLNMELYLHCRDNPPAQVEHPAWLELCGDPRQGKEFLDELRKCVPFLTERLGVSLPEHVIDRVIEMAEGFYYPEGVISFSLEEPRAFLEIDAGDSNSHFREGKEYEGQGRWLVDYSARTHYLKITLTTLDGQTHYGKAWMYKLTDGWWYIFDITAKGFNPNAFWFERVLLQALKEMFDLVKPKLEPEVVFLFLPVFPDNGTGYSLIDRNRKLPLMTIEARDVCMGCGKTVPLTRLSRKKQEYFVMIA